MEEQTKTDAPKKKLGSTQKLAAAAYAVPFASVVLPAFVTLGAAIIRSSPTVDTTATQLAVIDRLISFSQLYGLVAVGCILGLGAGIKMAAAKYTAK